MNPRGQMAHRNSFRGVCVLVAFSGPNRARLDPASRGGGHFFREWAVGFSGTGPPPSSQRVLHLFSASASRKGPAAASPEFGPALEEVLLQAQGSVIVGVNPARLQGRNPASLNSSRNKHDAQCFPRLELDASSNTFLSFCHTKTACFAHFI